MVIFHSFVGQFTRGYSQQIWPIEIIDLPMKDGDFLVRKLHSQKYQSEVEHC